MRSPRKAVRLVGAGRHLRFRCGFAAGLFFLGGLVAHGLDPLRPATDYSTRGWFTEDGLPSSRVRSIWQSRDGYLWLATAHGIARFDGARFVQFSASTRADLMTVNFYDVAEEADGTLWFASNGGLYRFREGAFQRIEREDNGTRQVRSVLVHNDGSVIAGTGDGLIRLRAGRIVNSPETWPTVKGTVRAIMSRPDRSLLVGGTGGIWHVSDSKVESLEVLPGRTNVSYNSILEESDGRLWIGTNQGLYCRMPDGKITVIGENAGLPGVGVEALRRDRDGNIWIGTSGGLFRLANGKVEPAATGSVGSSLVAKIVEGREGEIWVGSNSGLFQMRDTPIQAIGRDSGLGHVMVNTAIEAQDGAIWIGLWTGGVYRYQNGRAARIPVLSQGRPRVFYTLAEEDDGTVWLGGDVSLYRSRNGEFENFYREELSSHHWQQQLKEAPDTVMPGIPNIRVNSLASDRAGGLWVGTSGGLYHRSSQGFRELKEFRNRSVRMVIQTSNGEVWVTYGDAAARLKDGNWQQFRRDQTKSTTAMRSLYEDSTGAVWSTTMGAGLMRFKDERWRTYTTSDGLIDNFISSVIEDRTGHLWIGSAHGLMRVPLAAFDDLEAGRLPSLPVQAFNRRDGMPDSECSEPGSPSAARTRDGKLLFPTGSGVAVVDPRRVPVNTRAAQVFVENMNVDGGTPDRSKPIVLSPRHHDVQFQYTATSLLMPEKVRFKVRLAPLEKEWVEMGNNRTIRYATLLHGDYTFEVIASNNDGLWNKVGASLAFRVEPFFYQTAMFRALLVLLAAGGAIVAFRLRVRRFRARAAELQQQNLDLERHVAERTAELARSYETLRSSEYFYHSLVESLPQIIVRKDAEGRFTYANAAFSELTSLPLDRIIGRSEQEIYSTEFAAKVRADDQRIMKTQETMEYERVVEKDGKKRFLHVKKVPLYDASKNAIGVQVMFWDTTIFRETEERLRQAQHELVETSRLAGIAEVATGVLHNIGNALNSVNISATLAAERVAGSKMVSVGKVAQMLLEHQDRLIEFFATDPRGAQLPQYLEKLATHLVEERDETLAELRGLQAGVEHIKQIVAAQQTHAQVSGLVETIEPAELVEYALRITESSLSRHGIALTREFLPVPRVKVQRQKALQILVNLLRNAKESVLASSQKEKQISVGLRLSGEGRVHISVTDNGCGIAPENLTRIFAFGYTTKKGGHGFGLHSSALAAKEMGGSVTAQSEGLRRGATFVLELPVDGGS